jgi:hypothetical protein
MPAGRRATVSTEEQAFVAVTASAHALLQVMLVQEVARRKNFNPNQAKERELQPAQGRKILETLTFPNIFWSHKQHLSLMN